MSNGTISTTINCIQLPRVEARQSTTQIPSIKRIVASLLIVVATAPLLPVVGMMYLAKAMTPEA